MFAGVQDQVVPIEGNRDLIDMFRKQSKDNILYQEVQADHMTFVLGKDMSYFERVLDLLNRHNGKMEGERGIQTPLPAVRNKVVETLKRVTVDKTENAMLEAENDLSLLQKDKRQQLVDLEQR